MEKPYTIREAIGELDTIRMEVNTLANRMPSLSDLSRLVSELSSVMSWFARHMDRLEEELYRPELLPPELQEVAKKHLEWDGKSPHPYGCDGDDLYYQYRNLSDLWAQYASLVSQSGDSCSKSKQEKALAKAAAYLHSAIEEQEKALEREEKRLEEEGDE